MKYILVLLLLMGSEVICIESEAIPNYTIDADEESFEIPEIDVPTPRLPTEHPESKRVPFFHQTVAIAGAALYVPLYILQLGAETGGGGIGMGPGDYGSVTTPKKAYKNMCKWLNK